MRLIPSKTKVEIELFKGVTLADILVGGVALTMMILVLISSLPGRILIAFGIGLVAVGLLVRLDSMPNYVFLLHILRHLGYTRHFARKYDDATLLGKENEATQSYNRKRRRSANAKTTRMKNGRPKARQKAEMSRRKKEEKLLKSKKLSEQQKNAIRARQAQARDAAIKRAQMEQIVAFTGIGNGFIEYDGKYYGAVVEIPAVEFRFFSQYRRNTAIEGGLGRVLRTVSGEYSANIVKIERPVIYDQYLQLEYERLNNLKTSYESGMLSEDEYKARVEILYDRIYDVQDLCYENKVIEPFYYLVLFDGDRRQLNNQIETAMSTLHAAEMSPKRLGDKELAVFLKYTNQLDFDERDIEHVAPEDYALWAMPQTLDIKARTVEVNHIVTHNMRIVSYPNAVGDAWLASVMSMPSTKVVVKCRPMERNKAIRGIDRSLQELRAQYRATGLDSRRIEIQNNIDSLGQLLATLQQDNESLLEVNVYVTAYDIAVTRANLNAVQPPRSDRSVITNLKKAVRRCYQENGFRLNNMDFDQTQAFIGSQISGYDPMLRQGRGIPSNSLAACFPWIFAHVSDVGGIKLGSSDGVPVFIDFFRRDSERVNSNMVIVGKSGSGKSYATKSLLANLAAEDSKIFILDPENEYTELAESLHGKFINVGNAQYGRLNPFQIITALDDDETDGTTVSGSYATHLQFLEEFFRQILPDCDTEAMEYLNSLIDRMYTNHGITGETDLSNLRPEDYPIFDDLYDAVLAEFQQTDNEYIRSLLRTLMNYVAKFSTGGRNANIWNGCSTVTTEENFTVFNFQSLISNRNSMIANAQMLLVLKYIDNEIIKNRDYNNRYGLNRKIVVVIDEAHVFIDTKFPVALDFMFQLAKRIRKYNGMQIVITQNIKDFVGSEEIARKSTAIINACQYSFIFSLAPNDIQDLCKLYEKAGGINEIEQEQITTAPRGQVFTVMSPTSRSTFLVKVPQTIVSMFHERNYQSRYFSGDKGTSAWENIVAGSREKHMESRLRRWGEQEQEKEVVRPQQKRHSVTFIETDAATEAARKQDEAQKAQILHQQEQTLQTPATSVVSHAMPQIPITAVAENPAPQPVQSAQPTVDSALMDLLSRFSYDALLQEIQRSVEATVNSRLSAAEAGNLTKPKQQADSLLTTDRTIAELQENVANLEMSDTVPPTQVGSEIVKENSEDTEYQASSAEHSVPDEKTSEYFVPQHADDIGIEDSMDIVAFLQSNVGEIELPNPIETMDMFDEKVVDLTLEELIQYNNKQRGKRK